MNANSLKRRINKMIVDYKTFGKSTKRIQQENTERERLSMIESGMIEITPEELNIMILEIGYKLPQGNCFNYYNNLNDNPYLARCASNYVDLNTGQSFAHYEQSYSNHDNLAKLQKIRLNYFVYNKGRIWEL